ncbi:MAG: hypothetical protein K6G16_03930 [Lachnospiraceae bacterium]|nr:hypothetical protein [Lachnospiraceae bacterium]
MINFEEELKKFHPSLELDEAQDVIAGQDLDDVSDILVAMLREQEAERQQLMQQAARMAAPPVMPPGEQ